MKKTIFIILMSISLNSFSQKLGVGISAGIMQSNKSAAYGEFYIAYRPVKQLVLYPIGFKINNYLQDPTMPPIVEAGIGFQPDVLDNVVEFKSGISWSGYNPDHDKLNEPYGGFRPSFGLILHPYKNMTVSTGLVGIGDNKIFTAGIGVRIFK